MARLMRFGSVPLGEGWQAVHEPPLLQPAFHASLRPTRCTFQSSLPAAGQHFGIFVASPFTQPAVVQAAMQFTKDDCVQPCPPHALAQGSSSSSSSAEASGVAAQQQLLGKMPLRLAFPEVPTGWRGKDPIEVGCGTTELGDRPWLPQPCKGYFSTRMRCDAVPVGALRAGALPSLLQQGDLLPSLRVA